MLILAVGIATMKVSCEINPHFCNVSRSVGRCTIRGTMWWPRPYFTWIIDVAIEKTPKSYAIIVSARFMSSIVRFATRRDDRNSDMPTLASLLLVVHTWGYTYISYHQYIVICFECPKEDGARVYASGNEDARKDEEGDTACKDCMTPCLPKKFRRQLHVKI